MQQTQIELSPPKIPQVYKDLEEICLPLIEAYHDDLIKHDLRDILDHPGVPFLHFTGNTGTHLERLDPAETYPAKGKLVPYIFGTADRRHILEQKIAVVDTMKRVNRMDMILYYDTVIIRKISHEKAQEIIRNYARAIRAGWNTP